MPGDENDRKGDAGLRELLLECQPAHAGKAHVEHEASGCVRALGLHELLGRRVQAHLEADRAQQLLERSTHRRVVVDDEHHRALVHRHSPSATGSENPNTAPCGRSGPPRDARRAPRRSTG
jgi:hypothetical protein